MSSGTPQRIERYVAAEEADLRLAQLIEVDRQQFRRAGAVVFVGLGETRRQQADLQRIAAMQRAMAHHRLRPSSNPLSSRPACAWVLLNGYRHRPPTQPPD